MAALGIVIPSLLLLPVAVCSTPQIKDILRNHPDVDLSNAPQSAQGGIKAELVHYSDGDLRLTGYLASPAGNPSGLPGVLVGHDWNGRDGYEDGRADALAKLGYVAFAYDLYGKNGATREENMALMKPYLQDRRLLLKRLQLSLDTLKAAPGVDQNKIGAIGYCFGGMNALDMARANLPGLQGVVSFHGVYDPPSNDTVTNPIKPKILVCHPHNDGMVTPDKVLKLETELTQRNADWQVIVYGNGTDHGFTVPGHKHHPVSAKRAWNAMRDFFQEIFQMN